MAAANPNGMRHDGYGLGAGPATADAGGEVRCAVPDGGQQREQDAHLSHLLGPATDHALTARLYGAG